MTNRPLLAGLTPQQLLAIDTVAALLLVARTVAYVGREQPDTGRPWWLGLVLGCVAGGCVALRRWRPLRALAIVTTAAAVPMLLGDLSIGSADGQLYGAVLVIYIHAVDFPYVGNEGAVSFLADSHLSEEDKDKIAHGNADKLLGLS